MGDTSFSVQISTDLVNKLVKDDEQLKKRAKRRKPKPSRETNTPQKLQNKVKEKQISDDSKILTRPPAAGWPIQPPLFAPPPPPSHPTTTYPELDSIQSVLHDSEKVLEKLKKEEGHMTEEITQRAKDLHAKEYKLPEKKPMPCSEIWDAVSKCYKEHQVDTLKCASFVKDYEDCARQHRQEVNSSLK